MFLFLFLHFTSFFKFLKSKRPEIRKLNNKNRRCIVFFNSCAAPWPSSSNQGDIFMDTFWKHSRDGPLLRYMLILYFLDYCFYSNYDSSKMAWLRAMGVGYTIETKWCCWDCLMVPLMGDGLGTKTEEILNLIWMYW